MLLSLFSCGQKKSDKAFKVFNEGVALNIHAIEEQNKGNYEKAAALNRQSIDKFKETLQLDSTHPLVRSALGHSLYVDKQFAPAIGWFEKANKINGDAAVNYRELGLCKINLGAMQEGKTDIDKAFLMDTSSEIREITIQDLTYVGKLAFEYGEGYIKDGDAKKGETYKTFSLGVLMLAFEYDSSKKDIAATIADLAGKMGNKETAGKYKKLSE